MMMSVLQMTWNSVLIEFSELSFGGRPPLQLASESASDAALLYSRTQTVVLIFQTIHFYK